MNKKIKNFALFLLAAIVVATTASCKFFSPPKEVKTFRTLPAEIAVPAGEVPVVPLGKITFPEYLYNQQIAERGSDGKITLDERNLWAEPLSSTIKRTLPLQIAAHVKKNSPDAKIKDSVAIAIMRLDGVLGGDVEIVAYVEIFREGKSGNEHAFYFQQSIPTQGSGIDAYINAVARAVDALAAATAEKISD